MSDYGNLIDGMVANNQATAASGVVGNIDEDPDQAARAMELAQSSGIPSEQIYGNVDAFERMYKSAMASQIVQKNPHLQDYANSHPLAPVVSNDDWGNLDTISKAVQKIGPESAMSKGIKAFWDYNAGFAQRFLEGAGGFQRSSVAQHFLDTPQGQELVKDHRLVASIMSVATDYGPVGMVGGGVEDSLRLISGVIHGTVATAGDIYDKVTGTNDGAQNAEQFEQAVTDPGVQASLMGIPEVGPFAAEAAKLVGTRISLAAKRVKPFVEAKVEPPVGVDSVVDHAKAQEAKIDVDNLMEALAEAQKSATRERNPDMFANFVRQHSNAEIGISSEAVRKLYGDSIPMPDDGLLGFIPDLHDQLLGAEPAGGDVRIPLADWLAKVDPKVAKDLKDDIRVRKGGLTLEEAKNLEPIPPEEPAFQPEQTEQAEQPAKTSLSQEISARLSATDEPAPKVTPTTMDDVDSVRRSGGLGVNSIKLKKTDQGTGRFANVHDYGLYDDKGVEVGNVQLTDKGKDLHIEYIQHDEGPQGLGPRQVRDLARQLKQEFPNAETISGYRVSGARELAESKAITTMPLRADLTSQSALEFAQMVRDQAFHMGVDEQGEKWIQIGQPQDNAWVKLKKIFTDAERELVARVHGELEKIIPRMARVLPVDQLQMGGGVARGMYAPFARSLPYILWAVDGGDELGVARHEAIHHLRQYGFFNNTEWQTLKKAAIDEGWIDKFKIKERYKGQGAGYQLEEAIAEGFKEWYRKSWDESLGKFREADTPFEKVMQKLGRVYVTIKRAIKEIFGKDMDFNDIFDKVETGEVGSRRGVEPLDPRMFKHPMADIKDGQGELPGLTRISDRAPFDRGALKGMTKRTQDKYMELMRIRDEQDMEFAKKQNEKDVTRRQTDAWKAEEKTIRDQIKPDFENRPDLAADKFLRDGTLYGEKVKGKPRLDTSKLSPEQKAALPKDYHGPIGLHPDDAAGLFGYHSGNELVDALTRVHADRQASGLTPGRYVNSLVESEVARQMKAKHGDLAENILSETQDHVISQTQFDMLHEETLAAAMQAGVDMSKSTTELPFTKDHMEQFARQRFSQMRMGQIGVEAHLRDGLRANELAERALLDGDFTEGFRQKQKQAFSFLYAREAKKVEKQREQFEKSMKRFSSREVTGVDQSYTNFIHQIMLKIGFGIKRSVQDLDFHIGRSDWADLESFWRDKTDPASIDPREMPIAEFLFDPKYKKQLDGMSVDEFRAVNDSIKTMITNGRNEKTILKAGEKADLASTMQELTDQLGTFAAKQVDEQGRTSGPKTGIGGIWRGGKTLVARLLQLESIFNRIDRGDAKGLFNTLFSYPAAEASNHFAALTRKYAAMYRELKQFKVDLTERIPNNLFVEPISRGSPDGEYMIPMTRKSLRAVLQNAGNASNLDKLTRGYQILDAEGKPDTARVMNWLHRYAKKEDWDWAQAQGKIWDGIFHEAGTMVENLSGLPPEKIPLEPIDTQFGKYDGWYHKIVYDPNREGTSKKLMGPNAEEQSNYVRATTPRSWEKTRTGYAAPIDLNLDRTPIVMGQVLRDIAFRPFIHEASKIFYDNKFRMAMTRHFGDIYKDMLVPYLKDMGSTRNVNSPLGGAVDKWLEWSRQNIISTLIGLNPHTIYKHTFSAAINSIGEVGVKDFAREFKSLLAADPTTGQSNWDFAMNKSEELQRRHQQWVETLGGAHEDAIEEGGGIIARARSMNIKIGSAPIAFFDLASAVPTFLAKYRSELEAGSTEGEAIALGNRSVRRAHGSTAVSSRPEAMRGNAVGRMLTSLYGFFNQMLQRQYEMGWRAKEMVGDFKQGEYERGRQHIGKISTLLVTSVIAPAMIEEIVTGHHGDEKEGWIERVSKGIVGEMSSSLPVVRDVAHALINKEDPSIGLLNTPYHEVKNLVTDVSRPGMSMNRQHGGDLAKHVLTTLGMFTGLANAQEAKWLKFAIDTKSGAQRPSGAMEVYRGLASGQSKKHK